MKKVLIFGSFDIIHPGHLSLIRQAQELGEVHAVLALDETIEKIKGRKPLRTQSERKRNLEHYGVRIHLGSKSDRLQAFKEVQPDMVLLGYDQKVFVDELRQFIEENQLATEIKTSEPYRSEIFKSSKIRNIHDTPMSGFIMVDKESGVPSMRVVSALRKKLNMKKIGFAGTLDPLASGLLVFATGAATKIVDWWHIFPKEYEVMIKFGCTSDTYDRDGKVIEHKLPSTPEEKDVRSALEDFVGEIEQEPPMFSAKQVAGKRLYDLARKGEVVERKKQSVSIFNIELLSYSGDECSLRVACSTGTYIRSLAHDLGEKLGVGGVVWELRRTKIGPYHVDDAYMLEAITKETVDEQFLDTESVLEKVNQQLFPHDLKNHSGRS